MLNTMTALSAALALLVTFPVMGRAFYQKKNVPGVLLALTIAIPAWYLGAKIPIIGGPVFSILFGMAVALFRRPAILEPGIKATSKRVLQGAIVLLGFEMNLFNVLKVGGQSVLLILSTMTAAFVTAYLVSKALKLDSVVSTLIGVGTAICGGSAIAATAPVIKADDKQVAYSISTIFLFNVAAVFIFPFLGRTLGLSDLGFGLWAGTAINDTSSVVAAAYSFSDAAGNMATVVKLTRTLMIIPITFFLALYTSKKAKSEGGSFSLVKVFPWFILGFIATCIISTTGLLPVILTKLLGKWAKFFIILAMGAIGLNTNIKELVGNGLKPILLGLSCWAAVAVTSLVVQFTMGMR